MLWKKIVYLFGFSILSSLSCLAAAPVVRSAHSQFVYSNKTTGNPANINRTPENPPIQEHEGEGLGYNLDFIVGPGNELQEDFTTILVYGVTLAYAFKNHFEFG